MTLPQLGFASFGPAFKDIDKYFVGFDDQFNRLAKMHDELTKNVPNYPPYNIRKTGDNTYQIELAVAGFAKQDIEIELRENSLVIKGVTNSEDDDNMSTFLVKGIANRAFTRTFALNDQIEVKDADMINGMLRIFLERIIPDHKKPKKIEVKSVDEPVKGKRKAQLLTEDPQPERNL